MQRGLKLLSIKLAIPLTGLNYASLLKAELFYLTDGYFPLLQLTASKLDWQKQQPDPSQKEQCIKKGIKADGADDF